MKYFTETNRYDLSDIYILIAEDEPINMLVTTRTLEAMQAKVEQAVNGKDAIRILKENSYINMILLDLNMPVMDGYAALEIIKNQFPSIPAVAFTAATLDKDLEKSLIEKGFADCFSKGAKPYIIYEKILMAFKSAYV